MNFRIAQRVLLCIVLVALGGCSTEDDDGAHDDGGEPLFARLEAEETNIEFENALSEKPTPHRTELLYEYFTNGGGVAVGDVNGDGREDIYFTGNMRYNKLYLNEGDMTFTDVTETAGVEGRPNTWGTGVAMADVNGDGLLDIYVCYSGDLPLDRRVDELYINQGPDENGIPRFEERAEEYGLANPHSSNQAYFFDYDRDGDLDLFLQTHNVNTLPRGSQRSLQQQLAERDSVNGNRFYENREGTFVDVTAEVGIRDTPLNYGLGAGVADVNKDGWPDIYVGNDYSPPDYLYINDEGEGFEDQIQSSMGHTSRASMGVDVSDVNNDAWPDVFVLDMIAEGNRRQKLLHLPNDREMFRSEVESGFHHQYTVNTLQLNNGIPGSRANRAPTFSEIGQLAGISNTDWSWAPLVADFDNDGWKDLYVSNGILHDFTNRDFMRYRIGLLEQKNYDLEPGDVKTLMENLPSTDLENYAFENEDGVTFRDVSDRWNLDDPINTNGVAYADLDNDGDLDLIANNINEKAFIYENRASELEDGGFLKVKLEGMGENTFGIGAKVTAYTDSGTQYLEQYPARGYLSSVSPVLHFGLGDRTTVDSIRVVWPDGRTQVREGVRANRTLTLRQEAASKARSSAPSDSALFQEESPPIDYRHQMAGDIDDFRRQPMMVHAKSFDGPALAKADVDGDGLTDVFVGGGNGQPGRLYHQRADGRFEARSETAFVADRASEDVAAHFFDFNGNGHPDLYVASGGYGNFSEDDPALQDRLYVNDGSGNFSKAPDALPRMRTSTGTVASADVTGDGTPDLFVGGRVAPGRYPAPPRSYVLVNDGDGGFVDRTDDVAPALQRPGMVTDAAWHDLDGSGNEELVVAGEWMPLRIFEMDEGTLTDATDSYFEEPESGFWYSVNVFRMGDDDRLGLLAGNLGRNSQLRSTDDEPAELFYDDFDDDGRLDPLLSYYIDGERHPHVLLDRLRETVPALAGRFTSYEEYANATLDDLLTREEREEANRLAVTRLETTLYRMGDDGTFRKQALPVEAQFAPVFDAHPLDYNEDGRIDLILTGNVNETRVRFPKYDANYGVLLRGEDAGQFTYVPQRRSGFTLKGDVRSVIELDDRLLFGINRDSLAAYRPGTTTALPGDRVDPR